MRLNTKNHSRRNGGIALIWTAIMLIVLILFVGLALDFAKLYLAKHQLQNAADAAALAGAQLVTTDAYPYSDTRDMTYNLAYANYYVDAHSVVLDLNPSNDKNGDIVIGLYFPQRTDPATRFEPNDANANAVKVVARCTGSPPHNPPVSLNFGPIVNVNTVNVDANAIAVSTGRKGAGLIILDPHGNPGLGLNGSGINLIVNSGTIQVNSLGDGQQKVSVSNPSGCNITAEEIDICGPRATYDKEATIPDSPPVFFGVDEMPDPLRSLAPPSWSDTNDLSPINVHNGSRESISSGTWGPGYYSAGINISGSGTTTLNPGIYILGGAGLQVSSTSHIFTARGVMFYIPKGSGNVNLTGGPNLIITELKDGSVYDGMAIFQAGANPNEANPTEANTNEAKITGGAGMLLTGTLYFPKNDVILSGNSTSLGIQLICWTLTVKGGGSNTDLTIDYDGRNFTPKLTPFLVE